jgi:two-component system cell cycle sensor histidine kinase PleC
MCRPARHQPGRRINLLTNAIKFSPPKGGEVELMSAEPRRRRVPVALSVKDNGPGIPAQEIEHALSAFSRGSIAAKKAIDGAGLGLPIVKGLMDMHGGKIEIISDVGQGTEVICTFPSSRVLSGPRNELATSPAIASETQRKLINLTA